MVVTPLLHPDPRPRLRARLLPKPPPGPSILPIVVLTSSTTVAVAAAAAPESLSPQLPLPSTFFCSTIRHSRVHRDEARGGRLGAFLSVGRKDLAKILPSPAPIRTHFRFLRTERARKREQPSGTLREYKYINTLHAYMYMVPELPLAFVWLRKTAWTSR